MSRTINLGRVTGKSAYEIWLDLGNVGTEQDFVNSLQGQQGMPGKDGANGTNGKDGKDGTNGTNGVDGQDGNGIVSITKTNTSGLIDTYTITYTNGTTTTFQVTNGEGGTTDYSDLENKPSINGVTLLGNKTAEQLGITSSLCNLGKVEDYNENNRLDLNKLSPGIYWLYRRYNTSPLYLKATYKGNEVLGQWNAGEADLKKFVLLEIQTKITDDLPERDTIGSLTYFKILTSQIKTKSSSIKIDSYGVDTSTASETTISPVGLSNNQTITGKKTFDTLPESSVAPTTDNQLVNKKYVDDSIAAAITDAIGGAY